MNTTTTTTTSTATAAPVTSSDDGSRPTVAWLKAHKFGYKSKYAVTGYGIFTVWEMAKKPESGFPAKGVWPHVDQEFYKALAAEYNLVIRAIPKIMALSITAAVSDEGDSEDANSEDNDSDDNDSDREVRFSNCVAPPMRHWRAPPKQHQQQQISKQINVKTFQRGGTRISGL